MAPFMKVHHEEGRVPFMNKELWLLRPGKPDKHLQINDFDRPLRKKGRLAAEQIGSWLEEHHLYPDLTFCSPAASTRSTADCIVNVVTTDMRLQINADLYGADCSTILSMLRGAPNEAQRILVIGHKESLNDLALYLCPALPNTGTGKALPSATLLRLALTANWTDLRRDCAQVETYTRAKHLPETFPYPSAVATVEQRRRPAYYYRQSGIIPYRINAQGDLEILLIGKRRKPPCAFPKGVHEPHMTAQASAAKEALEEAGVEGCIDPVALGSYKHRKWGAYCDVTLFAMSVERIISEDNWQERFRGRVWLSAKEAKKCLKQSGQKDLLKALITRLKDSPK